MTKINLDGMEFKSLREAADFTGLPIQNIREIAVEQLKERYAGYERSSEMIIPFLERWIHDEEEIAAQYHRAARLLKLLKDYDPSLPFTTPAGLARYLNARMSTLGQQVGMVMKVEYDPVKGRNIVYYAFISTP